MFKVETLSEVDADDVARGAMVDAPEVRIYNPERESGYTGTTDDPVSWLNSARVTVDKEYDAVTCAVSVADPRGAFTFTVRRLSDGRLVIHVPHSGESMPHMATRELHPGTLEVGYYDPDAEDNYGGPADFSGDDAEE